MPCRPRGECARMLCGRRVRTGGRQPPPELMSPGHKGASTSLLCCFVRYASRSTAVGGGQMYPMAAYTSVRRRMDMTDLSKAVNHGESAFLALGRHGDQSTIRPKVYLFLATRASRSTSPSRPTGDQRPAPSLYDCLRAWDHSPNTLNALRSTPLTAHRPSTIDVPQNQPQPGTQKKPLNLLPRRRHMACLASQSPRQVCGADPDISHTYSPNNQLLPQIGDTW